MKVTFRLQEASSALTITTRSEGVLCYLPKQQQQKKMVLGTVFGGTGLETIISI